MSATTQCPQCGTRFKANQAQLEAYHGMVRCGHCHAAFDAIANRCDEGPGPQLILPIMQEEVQPGASQDMQSHDMVGAEPGPGAVADAHAKDYPELVARSRIWPWYAAGPLLSLLLLGQAAYHYRVDLAARLPGLKPALLAACEILRCEIPLPQEADLVSIESSDMEADPAQAGIITVSITLRNRATYAQAYPSLELTLTDVNDAAVGRRTFKPAEYLKNAEDAKTGLASNRESVVRLTLDTAGIQAVGYRLFLHY